MQNTTKALATSLLASVLAVSAAYAQQDGAQPQPLAAQQPARPAFSQQELDQMLAPIALYPDALLSQVLMAATYPLEVVEAARWSRANPGLTGDAAVRTVDGMNWDPSVKSLVAFPQVITMMDQKLEWTERLGDAFLGQQAQVTDSVQGLRQRAASIGNLRSNEQLVIEQRGPTYIVQPANPKVVYVPYYDPNEVYGVWAYPSYPPVYWAPPVYYGYDRPHVGLSFWFGRGISITAGFFFGGFDWGHRHVDVIDANPYYYRNSVRNTTIINNNTNITNTNINNTNIVNNNGGAAGVAGFAAVNRGPGAWQHDPAHRLGVPYRDAAVRQQFAGGAAAFVPRRDLRGRAPAAPGSAVNGALPGRPGTGLQAGQAQSLSGRPNVQGGATTTGRLDRFMAVGSAPNGDQRGTEQRPGAPSPAAPAQSNLQQPNLTQRSGTQAPQSSVTSQQGFAQPPNLNQRSGAQSRQPFVASQPSVAQRPDLTQRFGVPTRQPFVAALDGDSQRPNLTQRLSAQPRQSYVSPPHADYQSPHLTRRAIAQPRQSVTAPQQYVAQRTVMEQRPRAFHGVGQGPTVRPQSDRGNFSVQAPQQQPHFAPPAPAARQAPALGVTHFDHQLPRA